MKPSILFLDIETSQIHVKVFDTKYNDYINPDRITGDWHLISWAAKWGGAKGVMQQDARRYLEKEMLKALKAILDTADIVVTHNGKKFDIPKLNAKFAEFGIKPPKSYQQVDTKQLAKRVFGFTSNSLEYLSNLLCRKHKKSKHKKFPGIELWDECEKGNREAYAEMALYNKKDVLALEELYHILVPWDITVNHNTFAGPGKLLCSCGSKRIIRDGFRYTKTGRYQRYECHDCGAQYQAGKNELKARSILRGVR